ncbi:MAG TPA: hypothetical protein PK961_04345, partial [bacterium]|nr:hypothetical protein [bacterium]
MKVGSSHLWPLLLCAALLLSVGCQSVDDDDNDNDDNTVPADDDDNDDDNATGAQEAPVALVLPADAEDSLLLAAADAQM